VLVTDVYQRRCAITGEKALPVLQAAHIRPVTREGQHRIDNGLLLRSDLHALFDQGYVTVTPDHRVRVSRRLKDDFDNGGSHTIRLPTRRSGSRTERTITQAANTSSGMPTRCFLGNSSQSSGQ
jgi:hypothetical protein